MLKVAISAKPVELPVAELKVTAAPEWFVTEFGVNALDGIVTDKTGDAGFWRNTAVALRIEKRS